MKVRTLLALFVALGWLITWSAEARAQQSLTREQRRLLEQLKAKRDRSMRDFRRMRAQAGAARADLAESEAALKMTQRRLDRCVQQNMGMIGPPPAPFEELVYLRLTRDKSFQEAVQRKEAVLLILSEVQAWTRRHAELIEEIRRLEQMREE